MWNGGATNSYMGPSASNYNDVNQNVNGAYFGPNNAAYSLPGSFTSHLQRPQLHQARDEFMNNNGFPPLPSPNSVMPSIRHSNPQYQAPNSMWGARPYMSNGSAYAGPVGDQPVYVGVGGGHHSGGGAIYSRSPPMDTNNQGPNRNGGASDVVHALWGGNGVIGGGRGPWNGLGGSPNGDDVYSNGRSGVGTGDLDGMIGQRQQLGFGVAPSYWYGNGAQGGRPPNRDQVYC